MNSIQLLIQEICLEEGISFHMISNDWIAVLEKDGETHYIAGFRFDLNNYVSGRICNDKYACYDALRYHNLPVCLHHLLYPYTPKEEVMKCFLDYGEDVVVKANSGSYGDSVYHVTNPEDLEKYMTLLFQKNRSISMLPFYSILCEYRLIVLNGKVELLFGKKRPVVVGDGVHTIYELLCDWNPPFFDSIEVSEDLQVVLKKGETYSYGWQHNLSKGAIPVKVEDTNLQEKLERIAIEATNKLNLNFVSVDIVELENHDLKIIEINSGVVTNIVPYWENGEALVKELYRKAILAMFQK